jgi:hypothetical protein
VVTAVGPRRTTASEVTDCMDKVMELPPCGGVRLDDAPAADALPPAPAPTSLFTHAAFTVGRLEAAKARLNTVKTRLDHMDLGAWGKHTSATNPAGDVQLELRRRAGVEMCTVAFCKMYEMLVAFQLLPASVWARTDDSVAVLTTYHLCEAPGAFIAATNHYVQTVLAPARSQAGAAPLRWQWTGVTLNPWSEGNNLDAMIDDDRLILETRPHWFFGPTDTGNIMDADNMALLWARAADDGYAHLVTADGSISAVDRPAEQESLVAWLHYCEAVAAIGCLAPGGALVLKMFTLFEHPAVALLLLLRSLFARVWVCKPFTSKQGNSETYVVGRGFRGVTPELLGALEATVRRGEAAVAGRALLGDNHLSPAWRDAIVTCACFFADCQAAVIERNLRLYAQRQERGPGAWEAWRRTDGAIRRHRQDNARAFITRFALFPLDRAQRLAPDVDMDGSRQQVGRMVQQEREHRGGSFIARQLRAAEEREQLEALTAPRRRKRSDSDGGSHDRGAGTDEDGNQQSDSHVAHVGADQQHEEEEEKEKEKEKADTPMAKRARRDLASPAPAPTPPSDASSAPTGPEGTPSIAERLLRLQGYEPGRGLGAQLQGRAAPVEAYQGMRSAGLGYAPAPEEMAAGDGQWLRALSARAAMALRGAADVAVGAMLPRVTLSRFVSDVHLRDVLRYGEVVATYAPAEVAAAQAQLEPWAWLRARAPTDPRWRSSLLFGLHVLERTHGPVAGALPTALGAAGALWLAAGGTDGDGPAVDLDAYWTAHHPGARTKVTPEAVWGRALPLAAPPPVAALATRVPTAQPVAMVVADCLPDDADAPARPVAVPESAWKVALTTAVLAALAALAPGGVLVVRTGSCLTRYAAGVVYLLTAVFARVAVVKPRGFLVTCPDVLVVAAGYVPDADAMGPVRAALEAALTRLPELHRHERDVVEVVPPAQLLVPMFAHALQAANAAALTSQREGLSRLAVALQGGMGTADAVAAANADATALASLLVDRRGDENGLGGGAVDGAVV